MKLLRLLLLFLIMLTLGAFPYVYIWMHHFFVSGSPLLSWVIAGVLLLLLVLMIFRGYQWAKRTWPQGNPAEPQILFLMGGICISLIWLISLGSSLDIHFYDTFYVIDPYWVILRILLIFGLFSGMYFVFFKWFHLSLNRTLARVHFWGTFLILNMELAVYQSTNHFSLPGPRHYIFIENDPWRSVELARYAERLETGLLILLLMAQGLFIINILLSLWKKWKER
jgi:cytochrome c oxidase subunit I